MFKGIKTPILFFILFILNLFLISTQVKHQGENLFKFLFFKAASPVMSVSISVKNSIENTLQFFETKKSLLSENKRLKRELFICRTEKFFFSRLKAENRILKRMLSLKSELGFDGVVCDVVSKKCDVFSASSTSSCDKGVRIENELPVISYDGLVGYVLHRGNSIAEVELITNSGTAISVVDKKNGVKGIAYGTGGNLLNVNYIPYSKKVEVGDIFFTSGDDRLYPADIPVGVVKDVKRSGEIFQKITIVPLVNFSKLRYVFILIPYKNLENYGD